MFNYFWPLGLVVVSNILYQICTKSVPEEMNPLASLTVTYAVGTVTSLILYFMLNRDADILREYKTINWAPFVLGLVVVGLEVGFIYLFKAGWQVSLAQIVQSAIAAIFLIFVGVLFYNEAFTWNKVLGILVCLAGLGLIGIK